MDLTEQEQHGLLQEEVQKLIDGLMVDMCAKHFTSKQEVYSKLTYLAANSTYALEMDFVLIALKYTTDQSIKNLLKILALDSLMTAGLAKLVTHEEYLNLPGKIDHG